MPLLLDTPPSFSLFRVIRSHGWYLLVPFESDEQGTCLRYAARLASGRVVRLTVSEATRGLSVAVREEVDDGECREIGESVRWMLQLDTDLRAFHDAAQKEPKLRHVIENGQGRLLRSATLFEDTVKTILTTNTTWSGTKRMNRNLVSLYGAPVPGDSEVRAFPSPADLAVADEQELRTAVGLGYRAPAVGALARSVASGEFDLEALKAADLPTGELRKRLLAIRGVGPYAAATLLLLLGRYDFLPIDSWALKLVSHEWHEGRPVGPAEVERAFERWGSWKALAFWFWDWKILPQS